MDSHSELQSALKPLLDRFQFAETDFEETPQYILARFANAEVGIEVNVEWVELRFSFRLYQLTDSEFVERRSGKWLAFDADDLLMLRGVTGPPVGGHLHRKAPGQIERVANMYVSALLSVAADGLRGEAAVFDQLAKIVADREERVQAVDG